MKSLLSESCAHTTVIYRTLERSSKQKLYVEASNLYEETEIARACSREGQHHTHVIGQEQLSHFQPYEFVAILHIAFTAADFCDLMPSWSYGPASVRRQRLCLRHSVGTSAMFLSTVQCNGATPLQSWRCQSRAILSSKESPLGTEV